MPAKTARQILDESIDENTEFRPKVLQTLAAFGYIHRYSSLRSDLGVVTGPGFLDILAIHLRTGDMVVTELKRERTGRPTKAQISWGAAWSRHGADAFLLHPSEFKVFVQRLREGSKAKTSWLQQGRIPSSMAPWLTGDGTPIVETVDQALAALTPRKRTRRGA